ncbi:MAG: putative porin [Pseudomonadales bacterium]|mgnify:CR=1 FL=1|jgi:hypothetical protein|nr:putative porin [Pseudomonadales bacterium]HMU90958.1 putative porin [Pseudomonadales bacterium]HMW16080.1 putative porin [Pseudomonadales bacterium]HMW84258.1 putative porin [Pseudomonadales bacterium]HMY97840.1 putative porin [Pseudomonadales bacterium]
MTFKTLRCGVLLASALLSAPVWAEDSRASLEALRQTTLNLINALVDSGAITRQKADELIKKAEQDAAATVAQTPKRADNTVRVQYVPEVVKSEMREQIKQEVLEQAKREHWATPNAIPDWLDRIKWEGDLRLREQLDRFDENNATPFDYATAAGTNAPPPLPNDQTRAAEFAKVNGQGIPTANTTEDRDRLRLRARLGMLARLSDEWSGGVRLATGSNSDRVSTNQTLGQDFNKYTLLLDRAYLKFDPTDWLSLTGGRIPNPWFSTDLVWDEDLNFEGLAANFRPVLSSSRVKPFVTLGAFPLQEENPPSSSGRWLRGVQGGTQWDFSPDMRLKVGLAWYDYQDLAGEVEPASALDSTGNPITANYGQYEYGNGLRQKGNSLFVTNALGDTGSTPYWGLAAEFRPVNLTASLELAQFAPVHVVLSGDWVKNTAFDRAQILSRTQGRINLTDGSDQGYQYRLTVGTAEVRNRRDWQLSVAYRHLGSDAVLDAFTDSDFGLGGTNLKGYLLGAQYGLDRNTVLNLRWLSADSIDSFSFIADHKFAVDLFQADVSVKF